LPLIPAILYEPGVAPRKVWVKLDQLYSPQPSISRSDPRHNYSVLEQAMGTPQGRSKMPPIEVQPLGLHGQSPSTPLAQVVIVV
jgi:hypothetical protein